MVPYHPLFSLPSLVGWAEFVWSSCKRDSSLQSTSTLAFPLSISYFFSYVLSWWLYWLCINVVYCIEMCLILIHFIQIAVINLLDTLQVSSTIFPASILNTNQLRWWEHPINTVQTKDKVFYLHVL